MHVLTIVGARPQFIKAAALSLAIREDGRIEETLLHTGQHYDPALSEVFFDELKIPQPDYMLNVGSASHGTQTGKMLTEIEKVLLQNRPDAVLVYGDTNSTLAGALAAAKLHIRPYYRELQQTASEDERIRFIEPVSTTEIVNRCHDYDAGIYLLDPGNYNQLHALPNKLFAFIQARLGLVISPNPAMAHVVKQYECGIVSEDYSIEAFANAMQQLTLERVNEFKQRSHVAAKELCAGKANTYWLEAAEASIQHSK